MEQAGTGWNRHLQDLSPVAFASLVKEKWWKMTVLIRTALQELPLFSHDLEAQIIVSNTVLLSVSKLCSKHPSAPSPTWTIWYPNLNQGLSLSLPHCLRSSYLHRILVIHDQQNSISRNDMKGPKCNEFLAMLSQLSTFLIPLISGSSGLSCSSRVRCCLRCALAAAVGSTWSAFFKFSLGSGWLRDFNIFSFFNGNSVKCTWNLQASAHET